MDTLDVVQKLLLGHQNSFLKKLKDLSKKAPIYPVLLTEKGELHNSQSLSKWLYETLETKNELE